MDPITMSLIASAGGGVLGQILSHVDQAQADEILQQVRDSFGAIDPAKVQKLATNMQLDPQYAGAMRGSVEQLGSEVSAGGMGVQDRAALNDALDHTALQDRAQRAHINQSFEDRGAGGGAQNLLAQLTNQQGSAQAAQGAGLDAAGQAQQRYWQSVRDRFGMGQQGADAESQIARWNQQNVAQNNDYAQQGWENRYRQIQGQAGVDATRAQRFDDRAAQDRQTAARTGAAIGQNIDAFYGSTDQKRRRAP